jgi:hypothetical protein
MSHETQRQVLIKIGGHLEMALKEAMKITKPNTLDVQINKVRDEVRKRLIYATREERSTGGAA